MDFALTEEQTMIRESAESFLADVSTSEAIRSAMQTEKGYDAALWQTLCTELYLQTITIPEELGGLGLSYVELTAVMEQMGRYLLCAPYFSTVCLANTAIMLAANEKQKAELLGKILEGETATVAFNADGTWDSKTVKATYKKQGEQFVLNGDYRCVVDGHTANQLILVAREESTAGHEGLAFFAVDANAEGIKRIFTPTMDQTRKLADIKVSNLTLDANALLKADAVKEFHTFLDVATVLLAAEQVGGAQQVLDLTVEYTKERVQFNRPVASFQSVKHKAADMMTKVEAARSGLYFAACVASETVAGESNFSLMDAASVVKAAASDAYFQNAGDAIQLHGGVGFTWEYDVHLYFKRAKSSEHFLGDASFHRERIAKALLD